MIAPRYFLFPGDELLLVMMPQVPVGTKVSLGGAAIGEVINCDRDGNCSIKITSRKDEIRAIVDGNAFDGISIGGECMMNENAIKGGKTGELVVIDKELEGLREDLRNIAARLHQKRTQCFGEVPGNPCTEKKSCLGSGMVGSIKDKLSDMRELVAEIKAVLSTIEEL